MARPIRPMTTRSPRFYEIAVERLPRLGIQRYEISNFARPGFESLHNLKYWQPGALRRLRRRRALLRRRQTLAKRRIPSSNTSAGCKPANTRPRAPRRKILRRPAAHARRHPRRRGLALLRRADPPLPRCRPARNAPAMRLRLTDRGVMLSNEVFQEFLTA